MRRTIAASLALVLVSTLGVTIVARQAPGKTTRDKIYTKAQATKGAEQYGKLCATCHDPAKLGPGKKAAPALVGPKFFENWDGRTLGELLSGILTTMPNDGSAVLTEEQTADLGAYILQANGMPEGTTALKYGPSSKDIVIKEK